MDVNVILDVYYDYNFICIPLIEHAYHIIMWGFGGVPGFDWSDYTTKHNHL